MGMHRRAGRGYGRATKYAEDDVFSRWRRVYCYTDRAGVCAKIKRGARRRERRDARHDIRAQLADR
jgi:hypothetical protein